MKTRAVDAVEKRCLLKFELARCQAHDELVDETLVMGFHVLCERTGSKLQRYTAEYAALTSDFHHPDYFKLHG